MQGRLYIPHMCDHAYAMAAAFRKTGVDAEVLPPSDSQSLKLGKAMSDRECLPFSITLGDLIKAINDGIFDPEKDAFFMAKSKGPCRFGQYTPIQSLMLERAGYGRIRFVGGDDTEGYSDIYSTKEQFLEFKRATWQGFVLVDLISAARNRLWQIVGETVDILYNKSLKAIVRWIEEGRDLFQLARLLAEDFNSFIQKDNEPVPMVALIGEIYIRYNDFSNAWIRKRLLSLGFEVVETPFSEWFYYVNFANRIRAIESNRFSKALGGIIVDAFQRTDEIMLSEPFYPILGRKTLNPPIETIISLGSNYLSKRIFGEAILSIGKSCEVVKHIGVSGIVTISPFGCMPGMIMRGLLESVKTDLKNIPWLDLTLDGQKPTHLDTRLEAFAYQVKERFRSYCFAGKNT